MWHSIAEFYLSVRAAGLSHEAVIEIMVALLGLMVTVLALAVTVFSLVGYFELRRHVQKAATVEARKTATRIVKADIKKRQAIETSLSQKDGVPDLLCRWMS